MAFADSRPLFDELTGHGQGEGARVLEQKTRRWPALEVMFSRDDIRQPTEWRIKDKRHAMVVHLGGEMHELETEMDGHGGSQGPAISGEVWSIPAGSAYSSRARGTVIHYAVFFLDPNTELNGATSSGSARGLNPVAGVRDGFLLQAARQLRVLSEGQDDLAQLQGDSLSYATAYHLYRAYGSSSSAFDYDSRPTSRTFDLRQSKVVREFVGDNLGASVRLSEMAAHLGMSKRRFRECFKATFGVSPAQYVLKERLRSAQRLLLKTNYDITSVALACGFSSHSHLTHAFQKRLGCSPSAFRAGQAD